MNKHQSRIDKKKKKEYAVLKRHERAVKSEFLSKDQYMASAMQ